MVPQKVTLSILPTRFTKHHKPINGTIHNHCQPRTTTQHQLASQEQPPTTTAKNHHTNYHQHNHTWHHYWPTKPSQTTTMKPRETHKIHNRSAAWDGNVGDWQWRWRSAMKPSGAHLTISRSCSSESLCGRGVRDLCLYYPRREWSASLWEVLRWQRASPCWSVVTCCDFSWSLALFWMIELQSASDVEVQVEPAAVRQRGESLRELRVCECGEFQMGWIKKNKTKQKTKQNKTKNK